jgi:hypothetical protein
LARINELGGQWKLAYSLWCTLRLDRADQTYAHVALFFECFTILGAAWHALTVSLGQNLVMLLPIPSVRFDNVSIDILRPRLAMLALGCSAKAGDTAGRSWRCAAAVRFGHPDALALVEARLCFGLGARLFARDTVHVDAPDCLS